MKDLKIRIQKVTFSSVVTDDTVLEGNYQGKTDLCISGNINGDVNVKGAVYLEPTGVVKGSVKGDIVIVSGSIGGNLTANKEVELREGAKVGGYVVSREIHISPGAKVKGEVYSAKKGPFIFDVKVSGTGSGK